MKKIVILLIITFLLPLVTADQANTQAYAENIPPIIESVEVIPYTLDSETTGNIEIIVKDLNGIEDMRINDDFKFMVYVTSKHKLGSSFRRTEWCGILRHFTSFFYEVNDYSCGQGSGCPCLINLELIEIEIIDEMRIKIKIRIDIDQYYDKVGDHFIEVRAWDRHNTIGTWTDYQSPVPDFEYVKEFEEVEISGEACIWEEEEYCFYGYCYTCNVRNCYPGILKITENEIIVEANGKTFSWVMKNYGEYWTMNYYYGENTRQDYFKVYTWNGGAWGYGKDVSFNA
jgi:hypothetical protein